MVMYDPHKAESPRKNSHSSIGPTHSNAAKNSNFNANRANVKKAYPYGQICLPRMDTPFSIYRRIM